MPKVMQTNLRLTGPTVDQQVRQSVQRRIADCPYCFYFSNVTWSFSDGKLTLRGCVPSFYLKQKLQELLRGIDQMKQIYNEVEVVNSSGLSSVRPNTPR